MTANVLTAIVSARNAGTPLICLSTSDVLMSAIKLTELFSAEDGGGKTPVFQWDIVRGVQPLNKAGIAEMQRIVRESKAKDAEINPALLQNPVEAMMTFGLRMVEASCLLFLNANRALGGYEPAMVIQGFEIVRDEFKRNGRCAVLLGPAFTIPPELDGDVISIDEPLPDLKAVEALVLQQYTNANESGARIPIPKVGSPELARLCDAVLGLPAFAVEQVAAGALRPTGMDIEALWSAKRAMINQTPGLEVWEGKETFDSIGGCENIKTFMRQVIGSRRPFSAVVFTDEIEKALGGAGTELSGTTTRQMGKLLTFMQNKNARGILLIGHPGTAKSALAQALGNTAGVPTIVFDPSAMMNSLVGESEARTAAALKIVDAVSQGEALFVATCNSLASLPPELRRRFNYGIFFFDLPTEQEREMIWQIYGKKFSLDVSKANRPNDKDWTGAEIKNCAALAWEWNKTLKEAGRYIVPIAVSSADRIKALRNAASKKFVSASTDGLFEYEYEGIEGADIVSAKVTKVTAAKRQVKVPGGNSVN